MGLWVLTERSRRGGVTEKLNVLQRMKKLQAEHALMRDALERIATKSEWQCDPEIIYLIREVLKEVK